MTKYTQTKLPRRDVRYVSWCVFASSSANDMVKWLSTRINTWYTYMLWFSTGSLTPKKHLRCTIVFGKKKHVMFDKPPCVSLTFPTKKDLVIQTWPWILQSTVAQLNIFTGSILAIPKNVRIWDASGHSNCDKVKLSRHFDCYLLQGESMPSH